MIAVLVFISVLISAATAPCPDDSFNGFPIEMHFPSYQYCGPGTRLCERLHWDDPGINALDRACRDHDIAYAKSTTMRERQEADAILARKAWRIFFTPDTPSEERKAALAVATAMEGMYHVIRPIIESARSLHTTRKKIRSGLGITQ